MAWVNNKSRLCLAKYACQLKDGDKRNIEENYSQVTGKRNFKLLSDSKDIVVMQINGYELEFVISIDRSFDLISSNQKQKK